MAQGLGRGLSSLIPQKINKVVSSTGESIVDVTSEGERSSILQLDPNAISVNPMQPRKHFADSHLAELMESIKIYGIIQPLVVTQRNDGGYELIAGERRLRSAKALGLGKVPVIVRRADDQEKLELALIENIQRENLNPVETAIAYRKLMDEFNLRQEDMARRVGKSRSAVANCLRLLDLPEEIQDAIVEGRLSESHAKYISGLDNPVKQMALFRKIVFDKMSVGDTIEEVRKMGGTKSARIKVNHADREKELAFRDFFKAKVQVKRKGQGGQVLIDFGSDEELDGIIKALG
jgi:ParB family transcriptional regulator, chromosome partitioning protein